MLVVGCISQTSTHYFEYHTECYMGKIFHLIESLMASKFQIIKINFIFKRSVFIVKIAPD
ncbi:unnamed protein product [Moneuplotes crassus]|uniref:Uncharacterized protein n=1 Tax=Euplotes crassus TaxID=5936 RepID=A0AAD2D8A4_EUPCR|nr:unnamed protein product [Moneuplotes crassus]